MIKIGDKIDGRYRIVSRVATGGMADVYEATDVLSKKTVCLKVMKEALSKDPANLERFRKETETAASLVHINIVKVYGSGMVDDRPFIATEFIKGQSLRERLKFSSVLSLTDACEVMLQLCVGIAFIHEHQILHRDIKPDNLFYMSDGTVKITDFGIASPVGQADKGDAIHGTIYYCAPEILMGEPAVIASDIYSMGVVFFEMLTGQVPFGGDTPGDVAMKVLRKKFPEPTKIMPSIPKGIEMIIIKATKKRAEERYQNAMELHDDIARLIRDPDTFKDNKGFFSKLFGFK